MISKNRIDDKLWALHNACVKYQETDRLARLVLFAITDYINADKAPLQFIVNFADYPDSELDHLIKACLNGDTSANGIIKTCKKVLARN